MALPAALGPFQTPLGLAALAALLPLAWLYFVRSEPRRYTLPTIEFLADDEETDATSDRLWERFRIHLLFLLQAAIIIAIAFALAGPQIALPGIAADEQTAVVLDTSASMQTLSGEDTRYQQALTTAQSETGTAATLVTTAPTPQVRTDRADGGTVDAAAADVSATDAPGNLRRAIALAADSSPRDTPGQIVVISDFADASDWQGAVASARAAGHTVRLVPITDGGTDNVGIVDLSVSGTEVTATLANTGTTEQTRTVTVGDQRQPVTLGPNDITDVTFAIPAGGGQVRFADTDSFPVDDTAVVPAPEDRTVDVLLVSNDPSPAFVSALSASQLITHDVAAPPVSDASGYDVVVFGDVAPDRLLRGTVDTARETATAGGGVIVRAHTDLGNTEYGNLSLVAPGSIGRDADVQASGTHELTENIDLVPADAYIRGDLARGTRIAEAGDGSPIVATADQGAGRILYYGYLDDRSSFRYTYQYPVFWQQAILYTASRDQISDRLYATTDTLQFATDTTVETPTGSVTTRQLSLDQAGVYTTPDGAIGANLLSQTESAVAVDSIDTASIAGSGGRTPTSLTPWLGALGAVLAIAEVGVLRYRDEL